MWMSRFLLYRIAELYNVEVTFDPKPVPGDWNGAGGHVNYSTESTRAEGALLFSLMQHQPPGTCDLLWPRGATMQLAWHHASVLTHETLQVYVLVVATQAPGGTPSRSRSRSWRRGMRHTLQPTARATSAASQVFAQSSTCLASLGVIRTCQNAQVPHSCFSRSRR